MSIKVLPKSRLPITLDLNAVTKSFPFYPKIRNPVIPKTMIKQKNQSKPFKETSNQIKKTKNKSIKLSIVYRSTVTWMIEPTPRAVATKPSPQIVNTISFVGSLRV